MKKGFFIVFPILILMGCITVNKGDFNPLNHPEEDLVTVYIRAHIRIHQINNNNFDNPIYTSSFEYIKLRVPSGYNEFHLNQNSYSTYTIKIAGIFERNKTYLIKQNINGNRISYHIYESNKRKRVKEITINPSNVLINYTRYILTPTGDDSRRTVHLENDNFILLLKPDMEYSLTDKITGKNTIGRIGFIYDINGGTSTVYLLEANHLQMSRSQFLNSNYTDNAQIVLSVKDCSEDSVTYIYEKPESMKNNVLTFSINAMP